MEERAITSRQTVVDFKDDIGNKLARIIVQAGLMKVKYGPGELANRFNDFEKNALAVFEGVMDLTWSMEEDSNTVTAVIEYVGEAGFQLFSGTRIVFHAHNEMVHEQKDARFPIGFNQQIVRIFKEAMRDSFQDSMCKCVIFSARRTDTHIFLRLTKDVPNVNRSINSLEMKYLQLRASKLNASVSLLQNSSQSGFELSIQCLHEI